jgi:hypothetical protein
VHIHADTDGLTERQHRDTLQLPQTDRDTLQLPQTDIAPVLRRELPSRPFPQLIAERIQNTF